MKDALIRDDRFLDQKPSSTDWIMFVRTLKAYMSSLPTGGTLKVYQSRSWLPAHRLWIFTLGLLGRYAYRLDHGRAKNAPTTMRVDQRDLETLDPDTLYGVTGFFRGSYTFDESQEEGFEMVDFRAHDKHSRASLQPDLVPIWTLYWLCMGCVPLLDGRVFDTCRELEVHSYHSRYRQRQKHRRRRSQMSEPSDDAIFTPPMYRFKRIEDPAPNASAISWAQTLFNEIPQIWWMCESEVTTPEERADIAHTLRHFNNSEEISTPGIKTKSLGVDEYFNHPSLLWRSDVQALALGILTMNWSSRGYFLTYLGEGFFTQSFAQLHIACKLC